MRVGIYSRHWHVAGGGERVAAEMAVSLKGVHDVEVVGWGSDRRSLVSDRLGLDLADVPWREITDDHSIYGYSKNLDVFVNTSFGSLAPHSAAHGIYYVHFPEPANLENPQRVSKLRVRTAKVLLPLRACGPRRMQRLIDDSRPGPATATQAVESYSLLLANSHFTASWTRVRWGLTAEVLYPPAGPGGEHGSLEAPKFDSGKTSIVMLGRFIDPALGHCKHQLEAVHTFRRLLDVPGVNSKLHLYLVGGVSREGEKYLRSVRQAADSLPVTVVSNASDDRKQELLRSASIVWHLTGLGLDLNKEPQSFEHFGIAVVEAMAAGAVPIVLGRAGPSEIVRDRVDGFHIADQDGLIARTREFFQLSERQRNAFRASAMKRAAEFSPAVFGEKFRGIIGQLGN